LASRPESLSDWAKFIILSLAPLIAPPILPVVSRIIEISRTFLTVDSLLRTNPFSAVPSNKCIIEFSRLRSFSVVEIFIFLKSLLRLNGVRKGSLSKDAKSLPFRTVPHSTTLAAGEGSAGMFIGVGAISIQPARTRVSKAMIPNSLSIFFIIITPSETYSNTTGNTVYTAGMEFFINSSKNLSENNKRAAEL